MDDLLEAHGHTLNNRTELEASSVCGCCACMEIFEPTEIVADEVHDHQVFSAIFFGVLQGAGNCRVFLLCFAARCRAFHGTAGDA